MISNYDYSQAYTRGLKSRLLSETNYEQLLLAQSVTELVNVLKNFSYKDFLAKSLIKKDASAAIEAALWESFAADVEKIKAALPPEGQEILALWRSFWDIQNLKTVIRGVYAGASQNEIKSNLMLGGNLPEATFFELAKQPTIKDVIDLMVTWQLPYATPLNQTYVQFKEREALIILEVALDKYYYHYVLTNLNKRSFNYALAKEIIKRHIDITNIITLLRLIRDKQQDKAAQFFIAGGQEINLRFYLQLSQEKLENVVAALKETSYFNKAIVSTTKISQLELMLENENYRRLKKLFYAEPLSLAVSLAYLFTKLKEITNIRLILKGKEVGLPEADIRKGLVTG